MPYSHIETWCIKLWVSLLRKVKHIHNLCINTRCTNTWLGFSLYQYSIGAIVVFSNLETHNIFVISSSIYVWRDYNPLLVNARIPPIGFFPTFTKVIMVFLKKFLFPKWFPSMNNVNCKIGTNCGKTLAFLNKTNHYDNPLLHICSIFSLCTLISIKMGESQRVMILKMLLFIDILVYSMTIMFFVWICSSLNMIQSNYKLLKLEFIRELWLQL